MLSGTWSVQATWKPLAAASKLKTGAEQRPVGRGPCSQPPCSSNPTVPIGAVSLPGTANSAGLAHPLAHRLCAPRSSVGPSLQIQHFALAKSEVQRRPGWSTQTRCPCPVDFWTPPDCPVLSCPLSCLCRRRLCVSGRSFSLPRRPRPVLAVDTSNFRSCCRSLSGDSGPLA